MIIKFSEYCTKVGIRKFDDSYSFHNLAPFIFPNLAQEHTVVCGGGEGGDLFGPGAVPGADLDQDGVVVEEAGVLEARAVVVQQRHRVLVLEEVV